MCAVDIPDAACHWYVANADNTFGEGFDWENAPWFDANGLQDITSYKFIQCRKTTKWRVINGKDIRYTNRNRNFLAPVGFKFSLSKFPKVDFFQIVLEYLRLH